MRKLLIMGLVLTHTLALSQKKDLNLSHFTLSVKNDNPAIDTICALLDNYQVIGLVANRYDAGLTSDRLILLSRIIYEQCVEIIFTDLTFYTVEKIKQNVRFDVKNPICDFIRQMDIYDTLDFKELEIIQQITSDSSCEYYGYNYDLSIDELYVIYNELKKYVYSVDELYFNLTEWKRFSKFFRTFNNSSKINNKIRTSESIGKQKKLFLKRFNKMVKSIPKIVEKLETISSLDEEISLELYCLDEYYNLQKHRPKRLKSNTKKRNLNKFYMYEIKEKSKLILESFENRPNAKTVILDSDIYLSKNTDVFINNFNIPSLIERLNLHQISTYTVLFDYVYNSNKSNIVGNENIEKIILDQHLLHRIVDLENLNESISKDIIDTYIINSLSLDKKLQWSKVFNSIYLVSENQQSSSILTSEICKDL
jgi:hypothetical protein